MAEFLRTSNIKKTRKERRCFACGDMVPQASEAVEWVSVDGGSVRSVYVHKKCWGITEECCFNCRDCDDGDGFPEYYLRESLSSGYKCEAILYLNLNQ